MRNRIVLSLLILLSGCFFLPTETFSQKNTAPWGAFNQRIDVKPHRGKKFQVQAAVRVELIDAAAEAEVWVRVDKPKGKLGFFYNMTDKPIRSGEWKTYTISGTIDKDADWISFGGLYYGKGRFYYDDFKFLVESAGNQLEEVNIGEPGFEGDTASIRKHWFYNLEWRGFRSTMVETAANSGKHAFLVDGSGVAVVKTYGNNSDSGNYVSVNNIKMYYEVYGKGEPLLLLHGNSESIASFHKQIPELAKHYKVIALDSRAQGKSTEDGKQFTYELFAADAKAFLDELRLDSVHILGWSDGGNVGLIMAMQYPSKVKSLG